MKLYRDKTFVDLNYSTILFHFPKKKKITSEKVLIGYLPKSVGPLSTKLNEYILYNENIKIENKT